MFNGSLGDYRCEGRSHLHKTDSRMHVHGTDGVHGKLLDDGRLALYWDEAKVCDDAARAVRKCSPGSTSPRAASVVSNVRSGMPTGRWRWTLL